MCAQVSLPPGYELITGLPDDTLAEFVEIVRTAEQADAGDQFTAITDIRALRDSGTLDTTNSAWQLRHNGYLVGGAWLTCQGDAVIELHRDHRTPELFAVLLAVVQSAAADSERAHILFEANHNNPTLAWLSQAGAQIAKEGWEFEAKPADISPRPLPDGLDALQVNDTADPTAALQGIHQLTETCFAHWPDREPRSFNQWHGVFVDHEDSDAGSWWTITDTTGTVVGAAVCIRYDDALWVNQLAVAAEYRGQGVGQALLGLSAETAAVQGCEVIGLDTDSRTGAKELYLHAGFAISSWFVTYRVPAHPA